MVDDIELMGSETMSFKGFDHVCYTGKEFDAVRLGHEWTTQSLHHEQEVEQYYWPTICVEPPESVGSKSKFLCARGRC